MNYTNLSNYMFDVALKTREMFQEMQLSRSILQYTYMHVLVSMFKQTI